MITLIKADMRFILKKTNPLKPQPTNRLSKAFSAPQATEKTYFNLPGFSSHDKK